MSFTTIRTGDQFLSPCGDVVTVTEIQLHLGLTYVFFSFSWGEEGAMPAESFSLTFERCC